MSGCIFCAVHGATVFVTETFQSKGSPEGQRTTCHSPAGEKGTISKKGQRVGECISRARLIDSGKTEFILAAFTCPRGS
ncbi:hypothetical protein IF1G_01541 [Cordyceps javanica]|uniref:Uncharacterized protein n=1 Tax=Cordyceps javanica TaxID=43265 RepID=A0A545VC67_9HYPO|nr:hypothetical protein IF1G_01541 [Cordyceps javanica]